VPIAIEGQDLAAIPAGKFFIDGVDLQSPDGGILNAGVFFFQQQEMEAQGGKEGCETVFQALPQLLSLPVIQGVFQQHHAQIQVAVRFVRHGLAPEPSRP
jgi:hypothetical protein